MRVKINNAEMSFPELFKPQEFTKGDGRPRFSATFTIDEDGEDHKRLMETVEKIAEEAWDEKGKNILNNLVANKKVFYTVGNTIKDEETGETRSWYIDKIKLSSASPGDQPPRVISVGGENNTAINVDADNFNCLPMGYPSPVSGSEVSVILDVWAQDNEFGKRINAKLIGVVVKGASQYGAPPAPTAEDMASEFGLEIDDTF